MASGKPTRKEIPNRERRGKPFLESFNLITYSLAASVVITIVALFAFRFEISSAYLLHLGLLSILGALLFALDKWRAQRGLRRVSESNLLLLSSLGAAPGALLAMGLLRHKTQQSLFMLMVPLFAMVHGVVLALLLAT
jgi:uncharacterized membrane protein YsdA (DUF1294 family)